MNATLAVSVSLVLYALVVLVAGLTNTRGLGYAMARSGFLLTLMLYAGWRGVGRRPLSRGRPGLTLTMLAVFVVVETAGAVLFACDLVTGPYAAAERANSMLLTVLLAATLTPMLMAAFRK